MAGADATSYPDQKALEESWALMNARADASDANLAEKGAAARAAAAAPPAAAPAKGKCFVPIVVNDKHGLKHQCPECKNISGTSLDITHNFKCPNKGLSKCNEGGKRRRKTKKSKRRQRKTRRRHK